MTTVVPLESPPARRADALAGTVGRALVAALVGGLLIAAIEFSTTRGSVASAALEQLSWLARLSLHWMLAALPLGCAIGLLEHRTPGRAPSATAYAVAVAVGAAAGAIVMTLESLYVDRTLGETAIGYVPQPVDSFLYGLWVLAFWGFFGALLHVSSLRRQRGLVDLRAGEIARLQSERRLSEEQLDALQAQVEPEFLLTSLSAVERLYGTDPMAADRALDALIAFLRQAIPLLRRQTSTIGDEVRLVHSYLRAVGAATGLVDRVRVDVGERAGAQALPPGTLLSVVQRLLGSPPTEAGRASCRVHARTDSAATRVELSFSGVTAAGQSGLLEFVAGLEQRLGTSRGPPVTFEILSDEPQSLTLRITLLDQQEPSHEGSHGT